MASTSAFGWETPDDTDLVKDGAAAIRTLGNSIDTSMADLKGGTSGQVLSKASNTDMDFTWVAQDDSNAIQNAIVDAKGDLIAASANDTPARLAVGANGETLVADSSTSTGLRYQATYAAGKNAVINGSMTNWQRGTSFTATGYTADRWHLSSPGSNTVSRSTDAPIGFAYSAKWDLAGSFPLFGTYVELPAQGVKGQYTGTWTVSFWAKGSTNFTVEFDAHFANGSNRGNLVNISGDGLVALTTTWTRYSFQLDLTTPTINANNTSVELLFYMATGANSMFLTGFQFEQGSVATGFSLAGGTIQGELAACQRYYWRQTGDATALFALLGFGTATSSTSVATTIINPIVMRVAPTSVDFAALQVNDGVTVTAVTSVSLVGGRNNARTSSVDAVVASGLTTSRYYQLGVNNSSTGHIGFSAEL